jgi:methionine synthase II (cobalamin-independent)
MVPVLPTTVMGSCSVPQWLERLKTDYDHNRARIPGVQIPVTVKSFYYDYYDTVVTEPLPTTVLRHLPAHVARSKLAAMVEGTMAVRATLPTGVQTPPAGQTS